MSDIGFVYGLDFQRSVLKFMLIDHHFCQKSFSLLKEDYFTGELKWFFRKASEWFEKYKRVPTLEYFDIEVTKHSDPTKYEIELQEINKVTPDKDFIRSEMTSYIQANIFVGSYRQAALLYNSGNRDDSYSFIKKKMTELNEASFEREAVVRFGDYEEVVDEAALQIKNAIPTGIKPIDEAMLGGLMPQTWTTFIGPSNVGKSMLCPNLAYYAAQINKKTFVTIHEDEELPTKLRYLSRFSGVPYNKLVQPRMFWTKEEKEAVGKADEILAKHVMLRFMYGKEAFIENVADEVRIYKDKWGLDLFLCDYGQCLKSKVYKNFDNEYGIQGYVYNELKQLCLELKIPGAGGAQTNREGNKINREGLDLIRTTSIGDSFTIVKKSSNIITMNRSSENIRNNRIIFLLDKVRNGRVPVAVQCITDFSRCITHSPHSDIDDNQQEVDITEGARR